MRRAALLLYVLVSACHRNAGSVPVDDQEMAAPEQHPDEHAAMAAEHAMAGMVSNEDLHFRVTPVRPAAPGDSARAAEILAVMRRELAKYRDVRVAQDDGFREFIPASGAPEAGMNSRKPSSCATRTSRYLASSRRMTARISAARAESPGAAGRTGVSRRCRSSFDTIPAIACSAAIAACSSGCCSGAAISRSSAG